MAADATALIRGRGQPSRNILVPGSEPGHAGGAARCNVSVRRATTPGIPSA